VSSRWKIALALATITLLASAAVGVASYRLTHDRLLSEIDRSLADIDPRVLRGRFDPDRVPARAPFDGFEAQVIDAAGTVQGTTFDAPVVPSARAVRVAASPRSSVTETVTVDGVDYRMRTTGEPRGAVQVARSLDETDRVLRSLRIRTLLVSLFVASVAAVVGLFIAARVTASLRKLTLAAEHVESTGSLDAPVDGDGNDEVGRLGAAFGRMLAALDRSKAEQQRLVQDAGHELRTPLTSLRTNLDTLRRYPDLPVSDRDAIVADLHAETEELTELVNEIVAVASGDVASEPFERLDLAELATDMATRFERRAGRRIVVVAEPSPVVAQRAAVQRAVSCLLDNARKFDPGDTPIEVTVGRSGLAVADRGGGIPEHELAHVFERFHRADDARAMPGSGLGLSIVREVARRHGGDVYARNRDGGGAVVGFTLGTP
jgi:two-component system sensor histidine kinase MprB